MRNENIHLSDEAPGFWFIGTFTVAMSQILLMTVWLCVEYDKSPLLIFNVLAQQLHSTIHADKQLSSLMENWQINCLALSQHAMVHHGWLGTDLILENV